MTLNGPGADQLQIDASGLGYGDSRVIAHTGTGRLTIQNMTLSGGHVYHSLHPVLGGCIFSAGDVELNSSTVSTCYAKSYATLNYAAIGGGIFAAGSVTLNSSSVTKSKARNLYNLDARGGGVYAGSTLTMNLYSSLSDNHATANAGNASGGAAYSKGTATLTKSSMYFNTAYSVTGKASGGGLYAKGNAGMTRGLFKYNTATSAVYRAYGGGADVHGNFTLTSSQSYQNAVTTFNPLSVAKGGGARVAGNFFTSYSTIRDNSANGYGFGGGLSLGGNVTIASSTISGNTSGGLFGGIGVVANAPSSSFQINSSTISGNHSAGGVGGLYVNSATAKFYNTTIAFNTSVGVESSPGVRLKPPSPSMALTLQNTLLSNNTYGNLEDDFDLVGVNPLVVNGGDLATPAGNLIRVTFVSAAALPGDTRQLFCPYLGPLRGNGGLTQTHALPSNSVAIDGGSNAFSLPSYDQRGAALFNGTIDYPRVSGPKLDIGAYEVQKGDVLFNTDFEGCLPPPA